MKIGIFDPYLDTMAGGERYILSAALCLSKKHSVTVFWDSNSVSEIKKLAAYRFGFDLEPLRFADSLFSRNVPFLTRLHKSSAYDLIVYLSDGSIPFVFSKLFLHFQTPVEWVTPTQKTRLKLSRVANIFCNSEFTKSYIDKKFSVDSSILYPPVLSVPQTENVKKENIILNVGRFGINAQGSSFKKQDVLAKAFKNLIDTGGLSDWKMVFVVNADEDDEKLKEFIDDSQSYPIEVVVNPKNDILHSYYQKAKIYWHASGYGEDLTKHPDRAEHFGISTVEAMSAGCVPIVFRAGGQTEIVQTGVNGYLFEKLDELKEKTVHIGEDKKMWEKLSEGAKKRANDFSRASFCEKLSDIISRS